jgi:hypothetical protein
MAAQLIITLDDAGKIQVAGPLDNQLMCYGMLEAGKAALQEHWRTSQNRVQLAPGPLPPGVKFDT